jgi:hypothetical protein
MAQRNLENHDFIHEIIKKITMQVENKEPVIDLGNGTSLSVNDTIKIHFDNTPLEINGIVKKFKIDQGIIPGKKIPVMVTTIQYEGDEKEMPIALPSYNNLFWTPTDIMLDKQVEITKIGNSQGRGGNRRKNKKTRKSKKNRKSRKTKKN